MELICGVQNYEWGKVGKNSIVAEFYKSSQSEIQIDESKPYAELWMGCHPNMECKVKSADKSLQEVIQESPCLLGERVVNNFGTQLPFLFKVLSIDKALSIQAHPSKKLAKELHAKQPDIYRDDNYKPEMAIALTTFEALCGFRPVCEIKSFLKAVPELRRLVPNSNIEDDFELVKTAFKSVLQAHKEKIKEEVDNLIDRLSKLENEQQKVYENVELIQKLNKQFPGDIGIFMVYFLNYIKLEKGEAIFLAECEPHAYISGDCIECMACSDNVVRAGLTPKLIDVDTLVSMLTYHCAPAYEKLWKSQGEDAFSRVFRPPVPDFAVAHIKVPVHIKKYKLIKRPTCSILIVTFGRGILKNMDLIPGSVLFVPANEELLVHLIDNMEIFQAFVNVDKFQFNAENCKC